MSRPRYVIIGVTGPMGAAIARQLTAQGHRVRGINRSGRGSVPAGVDLVAADVKDPAQARAACADAAVVFQCASAPYTDWSRPDAPEVLRRTNEADHLPAITEGLLAAVSGTGARIVYGDNHYMYGPIDGPAHEDLPFNATDAKGLARAAVARRLLGAHTDGQVEVAIGCASDFFGPEVFNSTVGDRLFDAAIAGKSATILGAPDVLHPYSYIDDVAAGLITLATRPEAAGQIWNLPNDAPVSPRRFYEMAYEEAGQPPRIEIGDDRLRERHGYEAHLMDRPFLIDHGKFERAFGARPTPLRRAIRSTVEWYRGNAGSR